MFPQPQQISEKLLNPVYFFRVGAAAYSLHTDAQK